MPAPIRRVDELGFPVPPKFEDFRSDSEEPRPPRRSVFQRMGRWRWVVLLLAPALLFGPQLIDFGRGVVANIQIERAVRNYDRRDFNRALYHASRAIAWEPNPSRRGSVLGLRALIHVALHHPDESLRDCDEAIALLSQLAPQGQEALELAAIYKTRADLRQRRARARDAVDDCTAGLQVCPPESHGLRASLYNMRAYLRALSNSDGHAALQDIEAAINANGRLPEFLDTRACVRYRLGQYKDALRDMEDALRLIESQRDVREFPQLAGPVLIPEREHELSETALAVMYYHRGEISRKLAQDPNEKGQAERAKADFEHAKRLGFDISQGEALEPAAAERG